MANTTSKLSKVLYIGWNKFVQGGLKFFTSANSGGSDSGAEIIDVEAFTRKEMQGEAKVGNLREYRPAIHQNFV